VQIEKVESPALLPTLDALNAEFECEDEQGAAGRRRQGGAPMDSTSRPTQSEFPTHLRAARPTVDAMKRSSPDAAIIRPSLGRRASRRVARFLIVFCVGVGTTLAWQSYGDAARAMIATSSPQLGWLAPQTAPIVQTAPDEVAPTAAAAASPDLQQLALGLASVRQSVEQLAVQFAAGQRQMAGDIAKLQADEQEILHKLPAVPPRPPAAPTHKPAPVIPPLVQAR
jgi:hypothetical protein